MTEDHHFMAEALRLAKDTARLGNVPVGAVIVGPAPATTTTRGGDDGGRTRAIIGRGANLRDVLGDPTAHAELLALREAAQSLGSWRLDGCELYVTLAPCAMCMAAIRQARIARVVFGAPEEETALFDTKVEAGPLSQESREALDAFFQDLRRGRREADVEQDGEMAELVEGA